MRKKRGINTYNILLIKEIGMEQLVKDIMITDIITVDGLTKVSEVLEIFKKRDELQTIMIKPRNEEDVYGLITLRDIARKVIAEGKRLDDVHAYEIMCKPVITVSPISPFMPVSVKSKCNFLISPS